jgi:hypothetical protein
MSSTIYAPEEIEAFVKANGPRLQLNKPPKSKRSILSVTPPDLVMVQRGHDIPRKQERPRNVPATLAPTLASAGKRSHAATPARTTRKTKKRSANLRTRLLRPRTGR